MDNATLQHAKEYFQFPKSVDELNSKFREFSNQLHPDKGQQLDGAEVSQIHFLLILKVFKNE